MPMLAEMLKRRPADLERVAERRRDALGDRDRLGSAVDPVEQQRELVAAEPGEEVLAAHHALQATRDLREEQVADAVTERVVHDLEAVDVEVEDADRVAVARARSQPPRCKLSMNAERLASPVRSSRDACWVSRLLASRKRHGRVVVAAPSAAAR